MRAGGRARSRVAVRYIDDSTFIAVAVFSLSAIACLLLIVFSDMSRINLRIMDMDLGGDNSMASMAAGYYGTYSMGRH